MRTALLVVSASLLALGLAPRSGAAHPDHDQRLAATSARIAARPSVNDLVRRADLLREAGDFGAALADLDRAARLDRRDPAIALCRAAVTLDQGRLAAADAMVTAVLGRDPDDPRALVLAARVWARQGRPLEAAGAMGRALERLAAPTPDLVIEQARLLVSAGRGHLGEAAASVARGLQRLGPATSLEIAALDLDQARGDEAAALARLERLAAADPRPAQWLERRARLLRGLGDDEGARWAEAMAAADDREPGRDRGVLSGASRTTLAREEAPPAGAAESSAPAGDAAPARIAAVVTRGPFLQRGGHTRVTVRWRTDVAGNSRVRYGSSPASLTSMADNLVLTSEHEVEVTGLQPDTRYYYSVGTTTAVLAGGDAQHTFVTAPAPGTPKPTRIWVIGDSGSGGAGAIAVRDAFTTWAGNRPADLWLMLGDNAYPDGTDAQYQTAVFGMYPALLRSTVLWTTRGNHDILYAGSNNDYYEAFSLPTAAEAGGLPSGSEAYYSFDYGNIHFVCLDSEGSDRSLGGPMAVWLRADLAATPRDWVIAFWHHPPYSKGSHNSDDPLDSGGRMRDMRQNILPILDSAGVDLVLAGHSHSYERSFLINGHYGTSGTLTPAMIVDGGNGRWNGDGAYAKPTVGTGPREGCVYTVAGVGSQTGGGTLNHPVMVTSLSTLGSLVVDVSGNRLDARFLDTQRLVRDSVTIVKGVVVGAGGGPPAASQPLRIAGAHPARGPVRLEYSLRAAGPARLLILDAAGRRVATVRSGHEEAGAHRVAWDGRDARGHPAAPGVYFAVLEAGGRTWARRLVRLGD